MILPASHWLCVNVLLNNITFCNFPTISKFFDKLKYEKLLPRSSPCLDALPVAYEKSTDKKSCHQIIKIIVVMIWPIGASEWRHSLVEMSHSAPGPSAILPYLFPSHHPQLIFLPSSPRSSAELQQQQQQSVMKLAPRVVVVVVVDDDVVRRRRRRGRNWRPDRKAHARDARASTYIKERGQF